jgi:threonine dehydratase
MAVILIDILAIKNAQKNIEEIVIRTPFNKNLNYSNKFKANIFFKREDLQEVKSFKSPNKKKTYKKKVFFKKPAA